MEWVTSIIQRIIDSLKWFGDLAVAVFVAAWDFVRDAFVWPFEQLLTIVASAIESIDLSGIEPLLSAAGPLPAEIVNILQLLGIGTITAIIAAAIGIRVVLQLVPFTRLGS